MSAPTRYDLEFMAEVLGGLEVRSLGAFDPLAQRRVMYAGYSDAELALRVNERAKDPIANARAQGRIDTLLRSLPIG